jgi:hypothetical protein
MSINLQSTQLEKHVFIVSQVHMMTVECSEFMQSLRNSKALCCVLKNCQFYLKLKWDIWTLARPHPAFWRDIQQISSVYVHNTSRQNSHRSSFTTFILLAIRIIFRKQMNPTKLSHTSKVPIFRLGTQYGTQITLVSVNLDFHATTLEEH